MKLIRRFLRTVRFLILLAFLAGAGLWLFLENARWGYARAVSSDEQTLRGSVVSVAEGWLGANEPDGTHREIIDLYNAQDVLAQDYEMKYSDNWCAAFASAVAIQCDLTDIIPTECGCQRQIGLWEQLGRWEEDDNYVPLCGIMLTSLFESNRDSHVVVYILTKGITKKWQSIKNKPRTPHIGVGTRLSIISSCSKLLIQNRYGI